MKRRGVGRKVDPAQAKPERVAMALEREIRNGKLRFGSRLQSENELGKRFAVSRATVRKSLEALAEKGLITTKMGIGSFVAFDGQALDSALGWTRALSMRRGDVETRALRTEIIEDADLARALGQKVSRFIAIDRMRVLAGEGRVLSIERSRVPFLPELGETPLKGLTGGSLQATLRDAGLIPDSGEERAAVEFLSAEDAAAMGVAAGAPVLRTTRIVRDDQGRVIEHVVSLLDPKYFALHLEF
jgi:GntR family transcriptional regulator